MMRLIIFLLAFVLLSGCSTSFRKAVVDPSKDTARKILREKEDKLQDFYRALKQERKTEVQKKKKKAQRRLTHYVDKVWLGDRSEFFTPGQQNLPDTITHQQELVFMSAVDLDIQHIANRISEMVGIPVQVRAGYVKEVKLVERVRLNYQGSLTGLLDLVASSFEASWSYDRKSRSLIFTRLITRAFDFYAPPDDITAAAAVVNTSAAVPPELLKSNGWQSIRRVLINLMPEGSRIHLSPDTGKITITTTPTAMKPVAEFIGVHNRYFTREIHLNVQVLSFDASGGQRLSNKSRLNLSALLELIGLDDKASVLQDKSAKESKTEPQIKLVDIEMGKIIAALRKIGKVSVLAITDTRTRDGKITPIKATSQQAYLPRPAETNSDKNAPAIVTTGFSINLRPHILPHNRVQVNMSMSLRVLGQIKSLGAKKSRVQIPEMLTSSWAQETIIPDGTTLLVSGFERDNPQPKADGRAQETQKSKSREIIIILITPTIVDVSDAAAS